MLLLKVVLTREGCPALSDSCGGFAVSGQAVSVFDHSCSRKSKALFLLQFVPFPSYRLTGYL